ncbi:MAG: hypothetical protein EBR82_54475 [Caulobacteraceae bacterium]|nr:hypothetical protein [Caulobacteraceae bacterium]
MTHDPKAREVADNLALAVGNACCYLTTEPEVYLELRKATGDAIDVLRGRGSSGLRVVGAEPSEADVERVARAICDSTLYEGYNEEVKANRFIMQRTYWQSCARAALRAFLAQGGGDAKDV